MDSYKNKNFSRCYTILQEHAEKIQFELTKRQQILEKVQYKISHFSNLKRGGIMQQLIQTGYTARTTAHDVLKSIKLAGKTVIVTGGPAGLGLETTKSLAKAGATVIVPARNIKKAKLALDGIDNVVLYPVEMDLSKRETIESFVNWFQEHHNKLDILINSAGIMAIPFATVQFGNELQISSNYLGHYYLTKALLPQLKNANGVNRTFIFPCPLVWSV